MQYKENDLTYTEYLDLRESVGWNNFCEEQAVEALKNSRYIVVVHEEDKAIGMGRLIGDGMYYTIVDIVVIPEYQGKGIGTEIINRILYYVDINAPKGARISIQLISEKGKEAFYEKMGFKKIPHEGCGSGMRKVFYK